METENDDGGGEAKSIDRSASGSHSEVSAESPAARGRGEAKESIGQSTPFWTWLWFLGFLCLLGLAMAIFWAPGGQETGPFAMPAEVREHYAKGRSIKVEIGDGRRSVRVFVRSEGPDDGEVVVLLHGMGSSSFIYRKVMPLLSSSGMKAVAVDFPGSGLSDKFTMEEWRHELSGLEKLASRIRKIVDEVMDKGPFWRMEQLFQTGRLPEAASLEEKAEMVQWPVGALVGELGEALAQVLDSLGAHQVHLVFHDTGSEAARAWALRHPFRLRSVTLIDSSPAKPSLPVFLLGSPGLGSLLLGSKLLYSLLLKICCLGSTSTEVADAHAFLLRTGSGRAALLEMARMANSSENLGLWAELQIPMQILWSSAWSTDWKQEGDHVHSLLPGSRVVFHGGSRWPQEDAAPEVAEAITTLVSSLPPSERPSKVEQVPEHIQKIFDEMKANEEHHGHGHDHAGCTHSHPSWGSSSSSFPM